MSLKRRAKIQHSASPKASLQKQINQDLQISSFPEANKQNSTEHFLLQKMQQKIGKILKAYLKLEDQSKRKDYVISQLEKQNLLLKQRLVEKSSELNLPRFQKGYVKKQPFEGHVAEQSVSKPNDFTNPTFSIVRQFDNKNQLNRQLKQSRSVQNLNKTTIPYQSKFQGNKLSIFQGYYQPNEQENKVFSRRDENRSYREGFDEDKSFMDVLGKLRQKIKKFDQQDADTNKNITKKQQFNLTENSHLGLSKVKSSHNISRRPFNFKETKEKQQTQALKNIWSQRDEEIKRMDELFSKIDERINVIQKQ